MNHNQHIDFQAWSQSRQEMFSSRLLREAASGMVRAANRFIADPELHGKKGIYLPTSDDDLILLQFTRERDTWNKQRIFEGDIVEWDDTETGGKYGEKITGVVQMLEGCYQVVNEEEERAVFLWSETAQRKKIGNIFEDPEKAQEVAGWKRHWDGYCIKN